MVGAMCYAYAVVRLLLHLEHFRGMNPKEVLAFAQEKEIRQFDLRFTDLPGLSTRFISDLSTYSGFV
jgi:hypothetical protein